MLNRRMATKRTAIGRGPVGGVNDAQLHGGDLVPVLRRSQPGVQEFDDGPVHTDIFTVIGAPAP